MSLDVPNLPYARRHEILDRVRTTIGDEQYARLVSAVGEDQILKMAVNGGSRAPTPTATFKPDAGASVATLIVVAAVLVLIIWGVYTLFGEEAANAVALMVWPVTLLNTPYKLTLIVGGMLGAGAGAAIGALAGLMMPALGAAAGAGRGAWVGYAVVVASVIWIDIRRS